MLVKELKETVNRYSSDEKTKIIAELYRRLPKKIKETHNIDEYLKNIYINDKIKKSEDNKTFDELALDINFFLTCANNDLYSHPNKQIPDKERIGWRFKVKKYYKKLNEIDPLGVYGEKATDLLRDLYKIISLGSNYLTFSNWETFRAIGVSQEDFLEVIAKRKLSNGLSRENILYCVDLLDVWYDPYGNTTQALVSSFESVLYTEDSRYMAIEILKEKVLRKREELKTLKGNSKNQYDVEEKISVFTICILDIYIELGEVDEGIKYFFKNYNEYDSEIKEYILLERIEDFELYDDWIKEYESHLGKISYRDSLKKKYIDFKKRVN